MDTGESGFDDVTHERIAVEYQALNASHDDGQYGHYARNASFEEILSSFDEVMEEACQYDARWQEHLRLLVHSSQSAAAAT